MSKIKVISIFGTRPEAIKMAPLVKKLKENKNFQAKVCVTAQHREMLDQVLSLFNIEPDFDLNIMKNKQSLTTITSSVLHGLSEIFSAERPDIILVHGDTTTTFAASLAAFYEKIAIGHVEAGLRTYDKYFPFPEEVNRKLTGAIADMHFAPTVKSKNNLLREGVKEKNIFITGNTVIDAMKYTVDSNYVFKNDQLNKLDYKHKKIIMVTAHRRENWGKGIENICTALRRIVEENNDVELVYLVHLNPIVKNVVYRNLNNINRVHLLPPLDTKETHNLMNKCFMVMTDSGGLQEEAPHLGKPVLVLRNVTERPEAVEAGTVKLVGTDIKNIVDETCRIINNKDEYEKMSRAINPYGDGRASERIVDYMLDYFHSLVKNH
ncbi:UDP-N-acetylglucosamine 2-epimerase (non-hydrolysing) [Clostridium acetobutylicum]|uniref:UDP-N-acetylglucosamine 2-epimerase (non-hydrolyzing) n=1 Tax=Clostridium acetobutylicum (strain ATCC 824 / DSM 792 / JCM 1419 / IAM 19013 / LMG 5710 / NBRC 13948 / NRRL B-527 / VKM B-1787 / 2291 / W) TaxID=272562 RepID=Q97EP4_CLOAB|nr:MULTISPECIES: UDP-N-acetylglucosamine 2-epimerase (non-hydrolyzing) [Clostridium]AAK81004.1 UDP-N-acetylglucosamine 2-epimerase [Clostridium acetobutylicum ATCC 824]ADZ22107.1 UDP-N-acetylglucosamine 2-epimerase [Clostridium acetobutylicum EA 2018]AEI33848.1 UDP-N-acetylglucosamine 2-epimerase [Clostridium acetobutylicum DSM 1731]AWV78585.1 UDP-N-acetylglucosamine 2-epimerase (non-hydrolyzing) [Clostridium acetobutylicum]MBC2393445.1 UDP-N-acetylglucosamine 2-epimerase (non-hydrolyzing) [Cl